MSKNILIIIVLLIISSCNQPDYTGLKVRQLQEENKEKDIKCHKIREYPKLFRCENEEVICYSGGYRQGISCKWKLI